MAWVESRPGEKASGLVDAPRAGRVHMKAPPAYFSATGLMGASLTMGVAPHVRPGMVPYAWYGASGLVHMGARPADCDAPGLVGAPLAWFGA